VISWGRKRARRACPTYKFLPCTTRPKCKQITKSPDQASKQGLPLPIIRWKAQKLFSVIQRKPKARTPGPAHQPLNKASPHINLISFRAGKKPRPHLQPHRKATAYKTLRIDRLRPTHANPSNMSRQSSPPNPTRLSPDMLRRNTGHHNSRCNSQVQPSREKRQPKKRPLTPRQKRQNNRTEQYPTRHTNKSDTK